MDKFFVFLYVLGSAVDPNNFCWDLCIFDGNSLLRKTLRNWYGCANHVIQCSNVFRGCDLEEQASMVSKIQ